MTRDWFLFKISVWKIGASVENETASNKVNVVIFMTVLWHILTFFCYMLISLRQNHASLLKAKVSANWHKYLNSAKRFRM